MSEKPPRDINESILKRNIEHLRAAGRKGARIANMNKDIERAVEEEYRERKNVEEIELRRSTNEHILTVDGDEPDPAP